MQGTVYLEGMGLCYRHVVTTNHPSSSYGLPVLIIDGQPHGPGDLPPGTRLTAVEAEYGKAPPFSFRNALDSSNSYRRWSVACDKQHDELVTALRAAGYTVHTAAD